MTIYERNAGIFFVLLGAAVAGYSLSSLQLGTIHQPGPGLFPFISGAGIAVLSVFWLTANRKCLTKAEKLWEKGQLIGPVLAVVITVIYTALMEPLGYIPSTMLFLAAWQKIIERESWRKTLIVTVIGTAAMYFLFVYLLSTALPELPEF
jgi:putative tricarboxylic transport membrane protein